MIAMPCSLSRVISSSNNALAFVPGERCGRLVHDQDARVLAQGLGDLGQLPVGGAHGAEFAGRVDGDLHPVEDGPCAVHHGPVVDQPGLERFRVEEDVLRDGE